MTLALDDFSDRIIEPAMSVLAADIEADAMSMYKDVWNQVDNQGQAASFTKVLQGRKILVDNLAPLNGRTWLSSRILSKESQRAALYSGPGLDPPVNNPQQAI